MQFQIDKERTNKVVLVFAMTTLSGLGQRTGSTAIADGSHPRPPKRRSMTPARNSKNPLYFANWKRDPKSQYPTTVVKMNRFRDKAWGGIPHRNEGRNA